MANYLVNDTDLTQIADLIRAQSGTTGPLVFPTAFVNKMKQPEVEEKAVNFYDPLMNNGDGGRCYSYTKSEFLALTELPPNPDHSDYEDHGISIPMTSQGWNWSLAEAKEQIQKVSTLYIGQLYKPTDNKTHVVCYIEPNTPSTSWKINIPIGNSKIYQIDNEAETQGGASSIEATFSSPGWHEIKITNPSQFYRGSMPSNSIIEKIQKIRSVYNSAISTYSEDNSYGYAFCTNLKIITFPNDNSVSSNNYFVLDEKDLYNCNSLRSIILPSYCYICGESTLENCSSLKYVILGRHNDVMGWTRQFANCYNLVYISPSGTIEMEETFPNCFNLSEVVFSDGPWNITTTTMFEKCVNLRKIIVLNKINVTDPVNTFSNLPSDYKIIVPAGQRSSYISQSGWSQIASHIIEAS